MVRRKRKKKNGSWSAPMESAFRGVRDSAPRWISARLRPPKVDGLEETFSGIGFRKRARDPLPALFSASKYTGKWDLFGDGGNMDGAEGQNRTGYAGLFRAALYR
jgi:hypothetical protein